MHYLKAKHAMQREPSGFILPDFFRRLFFILIMINLVIYCMIVIRMIIVTPKQPRYFTYYDREYEQAFLDQVKRSSSQRILCAVFTRPSAYFTRATAVNQTWGRNCDTLLFITNLAYKTAPKPDLNFVFLNVSENSQETTSKAIKTFLYTYMNQYDFDWLLRANDDNYIVMNNLKKFLNQTPPSTNNLYYGYKYRSSSQLDFNLARVGYVIDRSTIQRFVRKYFTDDNFCKFLSGVEELDVAQCLREMYVYPGETRDQHGRERFNDHSYFSLKQLSHDEMVFLFQL